MIVKLLGCGTSGGVPKAPLYWGSCDPHEPKNNRLRASVAIDINDRTFIIDTTPDFRQQCLANNISKIDAVLYTHDHADHCHGIDDLRGFMQAQGKPVDIYGDAQTLGVLTNRFDYIFEGATGYPALCIAHRIEPGRVDIAGTEITIFAQHHGPTVTSMGYRIGDFAYSTDLNGLDDKAFDALAGVKVWIVGALRYKPHATHAHLDLTLNWIERVKPDRAILTHMAWEMDYRTLKNALPQGIEPGYDGLTLEL